ncbi:hypothetical protein KKB55_10900 [Myxococcota bacterium]|nr:hypothetical protein [Myxococcota bacterium]MBU1898244.1 hypothetical protein [Myxococcota bacterium]
MSGVYVASLLLTLLVEGLILFAVMGRVGARWAVALNLLTHPLAAYAHALFWPLGPDTLLWIEARWGARAMGALDLLSLELCVIFVEALALWWGAGLARGRALWLATLINAASVSAWPLLEALRPALRALWGAW